MTENRIAKIDLDEKTVVRRAAEVEHERKVAMFDLIEDNLFRPTNGGTGPYHLILSMQDNRLVFTVKEESDGKDVDRILVALSGFKRIVKDYFEVCESYFEAIKSASPSKIEAIDMGRRGLHNEGSELLQERLADKVEVDFDTARRLFTLLCVLQIRG